LLLSGKLSLIVTIALRAPALVAIAIPITSIAVGHFFISSGSSRRELRLSGRFSANAAGEGDEVDCAAASSALACQNNSSSAVEFRRARADVSGRTGACHRRFT
jgi:hypothetical protein